MATNDNSNVYVTQSAITALLEKLKGYIDKADGDVKSALETIIGTWSADGGYTDTTSVKAAIEALKTSIDSLGDINENADEILQAVKDVQNALTDINNLKETVGDDESGLVKDVADLKETVGDASKGLVKDMTDVKKDVSDLKSDIGDWPEEGSSFNGTISEAIEELNDTLTGLDGTVSDLSTTVTNLPYVSAVTLADNLEEDDEIVLSVTKNGTATPATTTINFGKYITESLDGYVKDITVKGKDASAKTVTLSVTKEGEETAKDVTLDLSELFEAAKTTDRFLDNVEYNDDEKKLVFTFNTAKDGTAGTPEVIEVDVEDLVDTYTATGDDYVSAEVKGSVVEVKATKKTTDVIDGFAAVKQASETATSDIDGLKTKVGSLEETVGDASKGLVKSVNDINSTIEGINTTISGIDTRVKAIEENVLTEDDIDDLWGEIFG